MSYKTVQHSPCNWL